MNDFDFYLVTNPNLHDIICNLYANHLLLFFRLIGWGLIRGGETIQPSKPQTS